MTRRELMRRLMQWTAAAGVGTGLSACAGPPRRDARHEAPRRMDVSVSAPRVEGEASGEAPVLIVGAGMAGLAAAAELRRQGLPVQVLDGNSRVGGRIYTFRSWEGIPLDMGASWIHGIQDNPVYALAQRLKLRMHKTDYHAATVFSAQGPLYTDEAQAQQDALFAKAMRQLEQLRRHRDAQDAPDISLEEGLQQVAKTLALTREEFHLLRHAFHARIEHEYAGALSALSLYHFDAEPEREGGDVLFPDGYGALIDHLALGLDIRLGQVVQRIVEEPRGVRVETQAGQVFRGRAVLVTVSLGMLKSGALSIEPGLEPRRVRALERLGMGHMDKLFLRFPRAFWMETASEQFIEQVGEGASGWAETLNLAALTGAPVLLLFNAAEEARKRQSLPDKVLVQEVMGMLRSHFGARTLEPTTWMRSSWGTDPFAKGAYSYYGVGSGPEDRQALGRARGRVHFAGEATSVEAPGTVLGAWRSGVKAAQAIVQAG